MDEIRAEVFIITDSNDEFIPFTQSRLLRDSLREKGSAVRYAEVSIFNHVDPVIRLNPLAFLTDFAKMYFQTYTLLRELE